MRSSPTTRLAIAQENIIHNLARPLTPRLLQFNVKPDRFVRSPAGSSRASLHDRLSRPLLLCRRAATSLRTKAMLVVTNLRAVHVFRLAASDVLRSRRGCAVSVRATRNRCMARTYYITAPPSVSGSHIRYSAFEVRCIAALFALRGQPAGFRRWLRFRWWLLVSSQRAVRHVRVCVWRQYRIEQRRQERATYQR